MLNNVKHTDLFCDYYEKWVAVYKEGAIRKVTLDKYKMTISWLKRLVPELVLRDLTELLISSCLMIMRGITKDKQQWTFIISLKERYLMRLMKGLLSVIRREKQ